eukprot:TRINITY_DN13578_c0_g1_i1.p1 TRINITY_DN13578_c0_g1~~TRINITY_DN13578_c0_g1_i1.p1  ORF type:complete len:457 (-),score=56.47 TRINITY_DN13578_c0_g1_i1:619-1920(-)
MTQFTTNRAEIPSDPQSLFGLIQLAYAGQRLRDFGKAASLYWACLTCLEDPSLQITASDEMFYGLYLNFAICLNQSGCRAKALEVVRCAISVLPDNPAGYVYEGIILDSMILPAGAIKLFLQALQLSRQLVDVELLLAITMHKLGQYATSVNICTRIIDRDPCCVPALIIRGDSVKRLNSTLATESGNPLQDYKRALAIDGKCARVHIGRGFAFERPDDYSSFVRDYIACIWCDPTRAERPRSVVPPPTPEPPPKEPTPPPRTPTPPVPLEMPSLPIVYALNEQPPAQIEFLRTYRRPWTEHVALRPKSQTVNSASVLPVWTPRRSYTRPWTTADDRAQSVPLPLSRTMSQIVLGTHRTEQARGRQSGHQAMRTYSSSPSARTKLPPHVILPALTGPSSFSVRTSSLNLPRTPVAPTTPRSNAPRRPPTTGPL